MNLFLYFYWSYGDDMAAEEIQINVNKKGTVSISYKQNSTFFNSQ